MAEPAQAGLPQGAASPDLMSSQYGEAAKYDARASLHLRFSVSPVGWVRWCFDQMVLPAAARVLDAGCGPGWLWAENAERVPPGWRVTLSDMSMGMVEASRERLGRRFLYEVGVAERLPHRDGAFDATVANHMLYHVPDRAQAIAELRRVLRPGGILFAATNGSAHLAEIDEVAFRWGGTPEACMDLSFSLDNGAAQLAREFASVELRPFDDRLEVTDAEAVVAYVRSLSPWDVTVDFEGLRREVQAAIDRHGSFHITKETGLFVATAPRPA